MRPRTRTETPQTITPPHVSFRQQHSKRKTKENTENAAPEVIGTKGGVPGSCVGCGRDRGGALGGEGGGGRNALASRTGSATPSSGRHMRPAPYNFQNAVSSDRERAHDLDLRVIVQGSKRAQDVLQFRMTSQWTCHRPKIARKRRSAGLCPPRTGPSAKWGDWPACAL